MSLKTLVYWVRARQSDHFHVLMFAPVLTLSFLSLVVRTADSAVDLTSEKKKVAQHLRHRLHAIQQDQDGAGAGACACHSAEPAAAQPRAARVEFPTPDIAPLKETVFAAHRGDGRHPAHGLLCTAHRDAGPSALMCQDRAGETPAFFLILPPEDDEDRFSPHTTPPRAVRGERHGSLLSLAANPLLLKTIRDPLARRVVSLTVSFEHGEVTPTECFETVAGDFDGQVLSFGILQWNVGSCSLQPLLRAFREKDPRRFRAAMEDGAEFIERLLAAPCDQAPALARRVLLNRKGQVRERWLNRFRALGRTRTFQEVQIEFLLPYVHKAYRLADEFGFHSERAIALFFDIVIQNGSIPAGVRAQYEQDLREAKRRLGRAPREVERMELLARRQAEAAHPRWVDTVRKRKITIVRGKGSVNGVRYDLDSVGIKLRPHRGKRAIALTKERTASEQPARQGGQGGASAGPPRTAG